MTREGSLDFMNHPNRWPGPAIMLKKRPPNYEYATLAATDGAYAVAYNFSIYQDPLEATWVETTPEALIADGWLVD